MHAHLGGGHSLPCLCFRLPLLLCLHPVGICALYRLRWARYGVRSRRAIALRVLQFLRLLLYVRHDGDQRLTQRNDDRNGPHKGWPSSLPIPWHTALTQVGHICAICCAFITPQPCSPPPHSARVRLRLAAHPGWLPTVQRAARRRRITAAGAPVTAVLRSSRRARLQSCRWQTRCWMKRRVLPSTPGATKIFAATQARSRT